MIKIYQTEEAYMRLYKLNENNAYFSLYVYTQFKLAHEFGQYQVNLRQLISAMLIRQIWLVLKENVLGTAKLLIRAYFL